MVLEFDTQKWRNKAMAVVSGTKLGSIIGEWLNGLGDFIEASQDSFMIAKKILTMAEIWI